jgi:integrase
VGVYPDGSPKYRASARYGDPEQHGSGSPLKRADGPTKAAAENALRAAVAEVFASRDRDLAQANEREAADRADAAAAEVTTLRALVARWHRGLDTANVHAGTVTDYGYTVAALFGSEYDAGYRKNQSDRPRDREGTPIREAFAAIEDKPVQDVSVTDLKQLFAVVARTSGPGAARRYRAVLRAAFHGAVDDGTITANTVMSVRYTKSDPLNPARYAPRDDGLDHGRAPDDDEVRDLIEALYRDPRALPHDGGPVVTRPQTGGRVNGADIADATLFLFSVGTRQAEMLALTWSRMNLSDHERKVTDATPLVGGGSKRETRTLRPGDVWINSSLTRVIGEGGGLRRGPVKVAAANRVLPMSATAVAMLTERAKRLNIQVDNPIGTAVFGSPMDHAQFRDNRNFMKKIQALYSDHGYDFGRTHSARKYVTTRLHRLGWSDDRIMAYMGWSDRTTLAAYLDRSQEVPDAMGSALAIDFTRP